MPMIKPRIRPHRLGSSRKFPRRDCSSETRRSRRPGIRLMRKLQSHANGAVPTAKLWVKVMWDVPVSRLTGAVKTSARMICSTTISRAAVRPYHISPVSCCTSTPAKAACHRLHRSDIQHTGHPAGQHQQVQQHGARQHPVQDITVQCHLGRFLPVQVGRPGGKGIGIDHGIHQCH